MKRFAQKYDQLPVFPIYRVIETGEEFWTILGAARAAGKITARKDHAPFVFNANRWKHNLRAEKVATLRHEGFVSRDSAYHEIEVSIPAFSERIRRVLMGGPGSAEEVGAMAKAGLAALRATIERNIDHDAKYIMPHSGGFDSRLISRLLREAGVRSKNIVFVCWEPETNYFGPILEYMGWSPNSLFPIRGGRDFYAPVLLDYDLIGRKMGECGRLALGPLLLSHLGEQRGWAGRLGVSAVWCDETMAYNARQLPSWGDFVVGFLLDGPHPLASERYGGAWMAPFASAEWVEFLSEYRIPRGGSDLLKRAMIDIVDPGLGGFENPKYRLAAAARLAPLPHLTISTTTRKRIESILRGSKCASLRPDIIPAGPPPEELRAYDPWFQGYIEAAMFDAMIAAGVEVA